MRRKPWVPVVLLGGVLALAHNAIYLGRELFPSRPVGVEDEEEEPEEATADAAGAAEALPLLTAAELRAHRAALPDPARSPFLSLAEALELEAGGSALGLPAVHGTLVGPGRRVAWVAGVPLAEGDLLAGFRLERIDPTAIVLRRGDERFHVSVSPPRPTLSRPEEPDVVE